MFANPESQTIEYRLDGGGDSLANTRPLF